MCIILIYHTVFYLLYSYGEFVCTYSCSEFLEDIFLLGWVRMHFAVATRQRGENLQNNFFFTINRESSRKLWGLQSAIFVQQSAPVFCFHLNDPFAIVLWIWGTTVVCCMFLSRLHGSCLMLDSLVWFFVTEIVKPRASSFFNDIKKSVAISLL